MGFCNVSVVGLRAFLCAGCTGVREVVGQLSHNRQYAVRLWHPLLMITLRGISFSISFRVSVSVRLIPGLNSVVTGTRRGGRR